MKGTSNNINQFINNAFFKQNYCAASWPNSYPNPDKLKLEYPSLVS